MFGNREGIGRRVDALAPRVEPLAIEAAQQHLRLPGGHVERRERRRLVVVDVIARRPEERRRRRRLHAIPLARRLLRRQRPLQSLRGAVAERLVAAPDRVVIHRHRVEIQVGERFAEIPGRDARHAERGQRLHFVEAQRLELGERDRIDVRVVRPGAVPRHEQRDALVQVVHDGGMPLEEHARDRARFCVHELMRVAIDVHERVLRPVRRRQARQRVAICLALEEAIEPFDDFVAPIGVRHRVDQHDQVLAHALDHRLLRDGQPVSQLQHGFRGAGFVRMQGSVEIVDRPCARDDLLGCRGIRLARIGQRGSVLLQLLERLDALLVRNRQQHDVASFLRAADREDFDAR